MFQKLNVEPGLCLKCRGSKHLCGRAYCPLLTHKTATLTLSRFRNKNLYGSSPPSVFIGRYGYPRVRIAPLVPPMTGDTSIYDFPENWIRLPIDSILSMRFSLVRAYMHVDVRRPETGEVEAVREIALSSSPVDVDVLLKKKPSGIMFDEHVPPLGPASPVEKLRVEDNPRIERPVEKVFGDVDMKAVEAAVYLYRSGVPVSRIARIFSVGALGLKGKRRLVPTRWSITAVDDILSRYLIEKVKDLEELGEILVYTRKTIRNFFAAILLPGRWSYEWIEAWFPHTVWNPTNTLEVEGDWEGYWGRKTYASLGGCYYATRLAVAEHMYFRLKRQARVLVLREIYEGFFAPIGVWFVRENVRKMFESKPYRASSVAEAIRYVSRFTRLSAGDWVKSSRLLRETSLQKSILEWVRSLG